MSGMDILHSNADTRPPLRIGLLLYPGCLPAGLFASADMLHAVNRRTGRSLFETRFVVADDTADRDHALSAHGLRLEGMARFEPEGLDAVLIPGFWAESPRDVEVAIERQRSLVATLAASPQRLSCWAYCTGVAWLAASGRLEGEAATVTWWLADAMKTRYPAVDWRCEQDLVSTPRFITAGGVNGHHAIVQALVEQQVPPALFRELAALMVLPRPVQPHPAFRALSLIEQRSALLRRLHAQVEAMPAERVTAAALAEPLAMSERTLSRKVVREIGMPVAAYARRVKLNQVSERLMLTRSSVSSIAVALGFSSESNLGRMFKDATGMTPQAYRRRFSQR